MDGWIVCVNASRKPSHRVQWCIDCIALYYAVMSCDSCVSESDSERETESEAFQLVILDVGKRSAHARRGLSCLAPRLCGASCVGSKGIDRAPEYPSHFRPDGEGAARSGVGYGVVWVGREHNTAHGRRGSERGVEEWVRMNGCICLSRVCVCMCCLSVYFPPSLCPCVCYAMRVCLGGCGVVYV